MFGMGDIAMGTAMEMNGAIDMADGMMLADMGMPGLGAMEMGMGAMEMGMGQNMINMGMMENMYGGYGMGMGYGMGGMMAMDTALMMGCMGVGCTLACCNPGLFRRGCMGMGCNLACCAPRRRFGNCIGFGCTGPCCTTTEVIIVNGNNRVQYQYPQQQYQNQAQYQYQNGYNNQQQYQNRPQQSQQYQNSPQQQQYQQYQNPPPQQYQNQNQYQNNTYRSNQPNTNPLPQQQAYNSNQKRDNYPQNPPQAQLSDQVNQQNQQFRQQVRNQNPQNSSYPQIPQYKQSANNQFNINNSFASQSLHQYQNQVAFSQPQQQSYQQNEQYFNRNIIYKGHLLKRHGFNWTEHPSALLTRQHLIDQPINHMTKIKIKIDPIHQNACFMKITMNYSDDHFYGCYKNQQCDWFCSIVWAKMALMGKMTYQRIQFTGYIEGNILRKSQFLGNWDFRHVKIDPNGLRSFQNVNSMATLHLSSIKELWTRFEYLNGGQYLVIKCKSNGTKYEYGIPVNYAFPWIKAFYSLLI